MIHALVAESCNAPGIATFQVAGALASCVAFSARFLDGSPVFYLATDAASPPNYEAGIGTYHTTVPPTISRDTVTENNLGTTAKVNFSGAIQVINFIASDKTVYVDSVGNAHVTGNLVVATDAYITGQLRFTVNASTIVGTDTGATTRTAFVAVDSANNTDVYVAGGASSPVGKFRVLNQLGSAELFSVTNGGLATVAAGLVVTTGTIQLANNTALLGLDTVGAAHTMIVFDSANCLTVMCPAGQTFRVVNHTFTTQLFSCDDAGDVTLIGNLQVNGIGTVSGGMNCSSTLFVQGASTLTGNVGTSGSISTFGSSSSVTAGWEYNNAGGFSLGSTSRSFGVIVGASVNVLANAFDAYSDSRLKTDIKAITPEMGLAFVLGVKPSTFIKAGFFEAGFIAQDMIRAGYEHLVTHYDYPGLPELDEGDLISKQDTAMSMIYDQTIAYLTAALQGMNSRVAALERMH